MTLKKDEFMGMLSHLVKGLENNKILAKVSELKLHRNSDEKYDILLDNEQIQNQFDWIITQLKKLQKETKDPNSQIKSAFYYKRENKNTRSFVILYNPQTKQLDCIVMCNSKDYNNEKLPKKDKDAQMVGGSFKSLKLGSSFNFANWPLEEVVKIKRRESIENVRNEYEYTTKLKDITKFNLDRGIVSKDSTKIVNDKKKPNFLNNEYLLTFDKRAKGVLRDIIDERTSKGKKLNKSQLFNSLAKLLNDLAVMHERNIVHLDIKDNNVLIDENNTPYFADFGLADQKDVDYVKKGTQQFLSPQSAVYEVQLYQYMANIFKQLKITDKKIQDTLDENKETNGKRKTDPSKHDVWALAITMFYLINGFYPLMAEHSIKSADPLFRCLFSVDEDIRPSAEEALMLLYSQYITYLIHEGKSRDHINREIQSVKCAGKKINSIDQLRNLVKNSYKLTINQKSTEFKPNWGQKDVIDAKLEIYDNFNQAIEILNKGTKKQNISHSDELKVFDDYTDKNYADFHYKKKYAYRYLKNISLIIEENISKLSDGLRKEYSHYSSTLPISREISRLIYDIENCNNEEDLNGIINPKIKEGTSKEEIDKINMHNLRWERITNFMDKLGSEIYEKKHPSFYANPLKYAYKMWLEFVNFLYSCTRNKPKSP